MIRRKLIPTLALLCALAAPAMARADFGFVPDSVSVTAKNADGTVDSQAGSHPAKFVVHFELKTDASGHTEGGQMRNTVLDLPPGFFGNPGAVPTCPRAKFEGFSPDCPPDTQVGTVHLVSPFVGELRLALFNIAPPPGAATELAVSGNGFVSEQFAGVDTEAGYGLHFAAVNTPLEITEINETIWGFPAAEYNDAERGQAAAEGQGPPVDSTAPENAYLTMPASCEEAPKTKVSVSSVLDPTHYVSETVQALNSAGHSQPMSGCDAVPFGPEISSQPSSKLASNPSGLDFNLKLPNQGLTNPLGIAETEPQKVVVSLPEGVSINPSFAEGIGTCSEAQYKAEQIGSKAGENCPEASKIGSLIVHTPLLEEPIEGALYLAAPYSNRFGTLGAIYMVGRAPERGFLLKQAGKIEFDQQTGQIKTTFEDLPPLSFTEFKLHFREGARAPLSTPQACGEYKTVAQLTPFSSGSPVQRTASFQITHGATGGACPGGGLPPFKPGLLAGSINAGAGKFSPFYVDLTRSDEEQEITHFSIKLPPGVAAKLAGVPFCSEAAIAQAKSRERVAGAGGQELANPSCPGASQIGRTEVGVGVGTVLTYVGGKVYLAGPYNGSALSVVAVVPAVVGPFDLGTVVVREALKVDPETGEVFVDATGSDPLPHIVAGIPVHARDIGVHVDRSEFAINPSGCKLTSTASTVLGSGLDFASEADDRPITVTSPFQAVNCARLPFKPKLSLKLKGSTKRGGNPALHAVLRMHGIGEAGIQRAQVTLPHSEFIDNAHFKTICTRVQFKAGNVPGEKCPPGSIYGKAKAYTPILSEPLSGPVYLRSSEHELPDVVASLHSGEIDVVLDGRVDSVKGKLRTTFETIPDAPVSAAVFDFSGAKKGLFENSTNLCAAKHRAIAAFTGHNGKTHNFNPVVKPTGCRKAHHKKHKAHKR